MYKFRFTQISTDYVKVGDEYQSIEVKTRYEVNNWDDLQNLFCTLVDFGPDTMKFEVKKELIEEVDE